MNTMMSNNVPCPVCKLARLCVTTEKITPGNYWTIAEVEPMSDNDICECADSDLVIRSKYDEALMEEVLRYE